ncbi:MAG: hypothetical protein M1357_00465 [Candidatus Marsarchaeota archaeon]|nr:hypothetical protein [Candidatus Marsarchaeota archaeon]
MSLVQAIESYFSDTVFDRPVVNVATQNYEDLVSAFFAQKLNAKATTVFLRTGFENNGSLEMIKEFAASCGWHYQVFDASENFSLMHRKVARQDKYDAYHKAMHKTLEQVGSRFRSSTLISGDLFSPSFEDTSSGERCVKLSGVKVHTPLCNKPLSALNQVINQMGLDRHLPVYPLSRVGLASQCIGEITQEKVDLAAKGDELVQSTMGGPVPGRHSFTAVADSKKVRPRDKSLMENTVYNSFKNINTFFTDIFELEDSVPTGKTDGRMLLINVKDDAGDQFIPNSAMVMALQQRMASLDHNTRVGYCLSSGNPDGRYVMIVRYFESLDFRVAIPSTRNWNKLQEAAKKIVEENNEVSSCFVDLSTKPPAKVGYL